MSQIIMSKSRKILSYLVLFVVLLTVTIVIGELVIRTTKLFGPSTFPFRQFDSELGVSLIPGVEGVHRQCYDGYVKINSHGMRDKERAIEKQPGNYRIAVFSDSVIEATHVQPEETATSILEDKLNSNICKSHCEVLNFSVGGFSTLENYLRYMRDGRRFNNDLVILVLTHNDLPFVPDAKKSMDIDKQNSGDQDNSRIIGNLFSLPYLEQQDGSFQIIYPKEPPYAKSLLSLFRHSDLAYFLYKVKNIFTRNPQQNSIQELIPDWAKSQPNYTFLDPENPVAARAWEQTNYLLDKFVDQVKADGAEFFLVHWGFDVGSNPWYEPIPGGTRLPSSFDPQYASKWFSSYAKKRGIGEYNLGADISEYIHAKNLKEPYLSFSCDRHFNPEGQAVIANLLYKQIKKGYIHDSIKK